MPLPDLVPEVDSRTVLIDVVELTEDTPPDDGLWVDFILPGDLHIPRSGQIIRARTTRVHLVDGQGAIRLPCLDADVLPESWLLLVRKSWADGAYPIQVPAGKPPISLAAIPESQSVTSAALIWALTGVSLGISTAGFAEGASGSARIRDGILDLQLRLPQGAPGLGNAAIEQQANGLYAIVKTSGTSTALDWAAQALGFYLLPGPATGETTRNGLPVYWIGGV